MRKPKTLRGQDSHYGIAKLPLWISLSSPPLYVIYIQVMATSALLLFLSFYPSHLGVVDCHRMSNNPFTLDTVMV